MIHEAQLFPEIPDPVDEYRLELVIQGEQERVGALAEFRVDLSRILNDQGAPFVKMLQLRSDQRPVADRGQRQQHEDGAVSFLDRSLV